MTTGPTVRPAPPLRVAHRRTVQQTKARAALVERRAFERYELRLGLEYWARSKRGSQSGSGKTCDISSHSLRFTPDVRLPANSHIELTVDWPARPDDGPPSCLSVVGTVLSCNSRGVVVWIRRYAVTAKPNASLPDENAFRKS